MSTGPEEYYWVNIDEIPTAQLLVETAACRLATLKKRRPLSVRMPRPPPLSRAMFTRSRRAFTAPYDSTDLSASIYSTHVVCLVAPYTLDASVRR